MKATRTRQCGNRYGYGILLACLLAFGISGGIGVEPKRRERLRRRPASRLTQASSDSLAQWEGLPVRRISFEGVSADRLAPLPGHLAQAEGAPLSRENLKKSLRQLFATGLFETIEVEGEREQDGVALVFRGTPRTFIGTVSVDGAKGATINTQLERASQLAPGTRFTQAKLDQALEQMRQTLAQNGFHEPVITQTLTAHPEEQLVDIAFHVLSGPQARVGAVEVTGDPGMSVEEFRRHAHLQSRRARGPRHRQPCPGRSAEGLPEAAAAGSRDQAGIRAVRRRRAKRSTSASPPTGARSSRCWWRAPASAGARSST